MLDTLPEEALTVLLTFVDLNTICQMPQVCMRFNTLLNARYLLDNLVMIHNIPTVKTFSDFSHCASLTVNARAMHAMGNCDPESALRLMTSEHYVPTQSESKSLLITASYFGYLDIVETIVKDDKTNIPSALAQAANKDHTEVVEFLIDSSDKPINISFVATIASKSGSIGVVSLVLERFSNMITNYNECLREASYGGHLQIVELLAAHATDRESAMLLAAGKGLVDIVRHFVTKYHVHGNRSVIAAVRTGSLEIVTLLFEHAVADNHQDAIREANRHRQKAIATYIQSLLS